MVTKGGRREVVKLPLESLERDQVRSLQTHLDNDLLWEEFRQALFPSDRLNLNPGTLGTPSTQVIARIEQFYRDELASFPLAQYQLGRTFLRAARKKAGELFGVASDSLAISRSTTEVMNLLTWALPQALQTEKLSVYASIYEHEGGISGFVRHPSYRVFFLGSDALFSHSQFISTLAEKRIDILFLSHVPYIGSRIIPLRKVIEAVRVSNPDCFVIVDAAQSLVEVDLPIDLADIVVASTHKWLSGPRGCGFVAVSQRTKSLLPALFLSGQALDEDHPLSPYEPRGGLEFSAFAGILGSLEVVEALGLSTIRNRSKLLADWFFGELFRNFQRLNVEVEPLLPHARDTSSESLLFRDLDPYEIYSRLNAVGVHTKCIKTTLANGQRIACLRIGVPYFETKKRLAIALSHIMEITKEFPLIRSSNHSPSPLSSAG